MVGKIGRKTGLKSLLFRGKYSELILDLFLEFGDDPFKFQDITAKFPQVKRGAMGALHNSGVIELVDGGKRAHSRSGMKNYWVLTDNVKAKLRDNLIKEGENDRH